MSDSVPYPWQSWQWEALVKTAQGGRLHHAMLVSGSAGVGKLEFASSIAKALLCARFAELQQACGSCERCHLMQAGTHPDFMVVDWLEKSSVVSVDQVRKLTEKLTLTATYGPFRIAIINHADTMTAAAYNGLLKTLEEPPGSCVLFLLAAKDAALPATIHSRCQRIVMPAPPSADALAWLQAQNVPQAQVALEFARGAPLIAQRFAAERDMAAIGKLREQWEDFLHRENSPAGLAAEAASVLDTGESLTLFMQWTTEFVRNVELSLSDGRLTIEGARVERRFLSQTMQLLQQSLRLDNASLKTLTVLEGVLADIRIQRMRIRAENPA